MKLDCIRPVGVGWLRAVPLLLAFPAAWPCGEWRTRGVNVGVTLESCHQQPQSSLGPSQEAGGEWRGSEGLN